MDSSNNNTQLVTYIFNVSSILLGVCITVISLFHITDKLDTTLMDEVLITSSTLFIICLLLAYLFIRNQNKIIYKKIVDALFLLSISTLFIAAIILTIEISKQ